MQIVAKGRFTILLLAQTKIRRIRLLFIEPDFYLVHPFRTTMSTLIAYPSTKRIYQSDSFQKGHDFEDYIITLFNERKFKLVEWRSDKTASNGVYPESCMYPDLEFAFIGRKRYKFAIECKWREKFKDGKIKWAYNKQIDNYLSYQSERNIPVFIAIGVGGQANNPEQLFVTPLDQIKMNTEVYESDLITFRRNPKHKFYYNTFQLKLF